MTESVQGWSNVDVLGCGGRRRRAALYMRAGRWEGSLSAGFRDSTLHIVGYPATDIQCPCFRECIPETVESALWVKGVA